MEVLVHDPYLDGSLGERLEVELLALEALLPRIDFLTLHVPLNEQTRGLVGAAEMAKMKPGAMLINCARGGVVDEDALIAALDSGHLAGAAVDVFVREPPEDRRLAEHPKTVTTPHIGAQTREAQERIAVETVRMLLAALDGSLEVTAVNLPFRATYRAWRAVSQPRRAARPAGERPAGRERARTLRRSMGHRGSATNTDHRGGGQGLADLVDGGGRQLRQR